MDPIPNRVRPILRKAVLCERVETDSEGRVYCYVPVHTIYMRTNPSGNGYRPPTMKVYLQLQEALGPWNFFVKLSYAGHTTREWRSGSFQYVFEASDHQIVPLELAIGLSGLTIPEPGSYELRVWANEIDLHTTSYQVDWSEPPMFLEVLPAPDDVQEGVL